MCAENFISFFPFYPTHTLLGKGLEIEEASEEYLFICYTVDTSLYLSSDSGRQIISSCLYAFLVVNVLSNARSDSIFLLESLIVLGVDNT